MVRQIMGVSAVYTPTLDLNPAKSTLAQLQAQGLVVSRDSGGMQYDDTGTLTYAPENLFAYSDQFDQNAVWARTNVNLGINVAADPLRGQILADKIIPNATSGLHYIGALSSISLIAGLPITWSVYAKADGYEYLSLQTNNSYFPSYLENRFWLSGAGSVVASGAGCTNTIQAVGGGWYRVRVTVTPTVSMTNPAGIGWFIVRNGNTAANYSGDGTAGIQLFGAQLGRGTRLWDYVSTIATPVYLPRFDYDPNSGVQAGENLARNSGFTEGNAGQLPTLWIQRGNTTITKVVNGAGFAGRVNVSASGSVGSTNDARLEVNVLTPGRLMRVQFKAKAVSATPLTFTTLFAGSSNSYTLTDGAEKTFSFTATPPNMGHSFFLGSNTAACTFDVYDIQITYGSDPKPYVQTGLDYNMGTVTYTPRGVLTEQQTTNYVLNSLMQGAVVGQIGSGQPGVIPTGWFLAGTGGTYSVGNIYIERGRTWINFSGTLTNSGASDIFPRLRFATPLISNPVGQQWSASMIVKNVTSTHSIRVFIEEGGTTPYSATTVGIPTGATESTISLSRTLTGSTTQGVIFQIGLNLPAGQTWTFSLDIACPQLELGILQPSSFVPTDSTLGTRTADVISVPTAKWYNKNEGTFYVEYENAARSATQGVIAVNDGTTVNRHQILSSGNTHVNFAAALNSANSSINVGNAGILKNKAVYSYQGVTITAHLNNSAAQTNTISAMPPVNTLLIGRFHGTTAFLNGWIKRITYWPKKLPNNYLQKLTI